MASCILRVRITIEYQLQVQYFTFSVQNVLNSLYDGWITTAGLAFTKHSGIGSVPQKRMQNIRNTITLQRPMVGG
jgi:CRISPR/Cas system CMR-associated protein Cmr1 (group 7 of RAMP superfamily)